MSMNLYDTAVLNFYRIDYRCIISGTRKSEAVNLLQNTGFSEKSGSL